MFQKLIVYKYFSIITRYHRKVLLGKHFAKKTCRDLMERWSRMVPAPYRVAALPVSAIPALSIKSNASPTASTLSELLIKCTIISKLERRHVLLITTCNCIFKMVFFRAKSINGYATGLYLANLLKYVPGERRNIAFHLNQALFTFLHRGRTAARLIPISGANAQSFFHSCTVLPH